MDVQTTPVVKRPASLRRSVLIQNTPSSMRPPASSGASPVVLLVRPDEESERSRRRSAVSMQKRLSNISSATSSPLVELNRVLNEKDVNEHLQVCNKLYSENRISSKNAWELYIIDVLKQYISSVAAGGNQMQIASTALDISGKVYGLRVDDVHTVGMKLASSMNSKQTANDKGDSGDDENPDPGAPRQKQRKKKAIVKKNTLDKEGTSLFGPLQKMDSVFFSTRENVECGATENLLTLKLMHHPSGHRFMKLGKEKCWMTEPDCVMQDPEIKQKKPFELPRVSRFNLCQPFHDFDVVEWDPNAEAQQEASSLNNDMVFDDKGLPIPELDGSIHNIFENDGDDDGMSGDDDDNHPHHQDEAMEVQRHNGGLGALVEMLPEEHRFPTEYGYNALLTTSSGKVIDRIWAGPSHWKVKYIRRVPARYSGTVVKVNPEVPRRKRVTKVVETLNFTLEEDDPPLIDLSKKVNTKKTLSTTDVEKITLPVANVHLMNLKQTLMFKAVVPNKQSTTPPIEGEVPAYNYDNPNDSEYCSQNGVDDNDNGADTQDEAEDNVVASQENNFLDEHLVNAPETVAKMTISYALKAKKMDMRKLKTAVWQDLTHKIPNLKQPENFDGTVQPTTFSSLYTTLPHYLTTEMKKEVTCPLAFVALLHLCNEQNLKLEAQPDSDFANFNIRKVSRLHE